MATVKSGINFENQNLEKKGKKKKEEKEERIKRKLRWENRKDEEKK